VKVETGLRKEVDCFLTTVEQCRGDIKFEGLIGRRAT
jgi:hypothetical protein